MPAHRADNHFWREMFALRGSVTPYVFRRAVVFGIFALLVYVIDVFLEIKLSVDLGAYEVVGAVLGLLLVFRTNAGYDRWYEGRKLWGGIVNDTRNLAITSLAHGPDDRAWRETVVRWIACFPHVVRASLRGESLPAEVRSLIGSQGAGELAQAENRPLFVALKIGELMRQACEDYGMDPLAFLKADTEREKLIDHYGACERILKTPVPWAYSVNVRRAIFLYMVAVPFAMIDRIGWLTPLATIVIGYPILALDQLGIELQNPFALKNLNHLPLDEISAKIESNLLGLLAADRERVNR